ncbi:hypothetical protein M0805_004520 [Coniferiporia weirii]|nr:hypothetical protein M0805_004520 [Coniferiporia weirii]
MSLLVTTARCAAPTLTRIGRQHPRWARSSHFDAFGMDPNNKKHMYAYYAATVGVLLLPVFAVRYQISKMKEDRRHF